jgi:hypothetical protein
VLDGACVGPRELDDYCASRGGARAGVACPVHACTTEDALDLATMACVPGARARSLLGRIRPIPDDLDVTCREGSVLALRGDYAACLSPADVCPRGTDWDAQARACEPTPACGAGEVRRESPGASGACARVVTRETEGAPVVDVGLWARVVLGSDGGDGTKRLCRPLAQAAALDLGPGGARTFGLTINVVFPDNDVTQLSGRADAVGDQDRGALAAAGNAALLPLLVPLRSMGGVADAASVTVRVRCTVDGGASPELIPRPRMAPPR